MIQFFDDFVEVCFLVDAGGDLVVATGVELLHLHFHDGISRTFKPGLGSK